MSTLWLLFVPVCAAIYTLLLPIAPNDFWYHVRAGAEIATTGHIPTTALFTTSVPPNTAYFYQSWLSELALFKILQSSGLVGIIIFRTLCLTATFALLQWASWRRMQRIKPDAAPNVTSKLVAASTLLAFALSASNMDVRPQTFSMPLFGVFVFCLFEWPFLAPPRRVLVTVALAVLMLLWVNTHGAFFTGLVAVAVWASGELLHTVLSKRKAFISWFGAPLPNTTLRAALLLFMLCALSTLVNPRGFGIYHYVFLLAQLQANQKFIQEWQAPRFSDWYGALFFLTLLLLALLAGVLALRNRNRMSETSDGSTPFGAMGVRFSEVLVLLALSMMALRDVRSIIWFALWGATFLTAMSTRLLRGNAQEEDVPRAAQFVNMAILMLLLVSLVPALPWYKTALPLPPEYFRHFAPNPNGAFKAPPPVGSNDPPYLLDRDTPVEAIAALLMHPPHGKLWNDFVYGSYLAWATIYEPRLAPYADPRVEMRDLKFWEEYGRISDGAQDAAAILAAQGFSDALLNKKDQKNLVKRLRDAGWREMQSFKGGAVWLRRVQ